MIGNIRKLIIRCREDDPTSLDYHLPVADQMVDLRPYLGKTLRLRHTGAIHCINCGRQTKKSFSQGYCFPCCRRLAACDLCIVRPENCHYDKGTCREPDWAMQHCMIEHVVYLANTSGLKIGITRHSQIPTRWLDQGASQALPIYRVKSRHLAGLMEVTIGEHVADKTNWRTLLKQDAGQLDLAAERDKLVAHVNAALPPLRQRFGETSITACDDEPVRHFRYPVLQYPEKIKSFNFDKTPLVEGLLQGIKGQYLIFDGGVINIRKFTGYQLEVDDQPTGPA